MLKLIHTIFTSSVFKLFIRFLASLASAIAVISGYLIYLNMLAKNKEEDVVKDEELEKLEKEGKDLEDKI